MLEGEVNVMKQKIIRLNEIAEQHSQQTEVVESAFSAATTGAQRAINDLNQNMMKKVDEIYADKYCHKSTITNLFGVNKNIEKVEDEAPPMKEAITQTVFPKNFANT